MSLLLWIKLLVICFWGRDQFCFDTFDDVVKFVKTIKVDILKRSTINWYPYQHCPGWNWLDKNQLVLRNSIHYRKSENKIRVEDLSDVVVKFLFFIFHFYYFYKIMKLLKLSIQIRAQNQCMFGEQMCYYWVVELSKSRFEIGWYLLKAKSYLFVENFY